MIDNQLDPNKTLLYVIYNREGMHVVIDIDIWYMKYEWCISWFCWYIPLDFFFERKILLKVGTQAVFQLPNREYTIYDIKTPPTPTKPPRKNNYTEQLYSLNLSSKLAQNKTSKQKFSKPEPFSSLSQNIHTTLTQAKYSSHSNFFYRR